MQQLAAQQRAERARQQEQELYAAARRSPGTEEEAEEAQEEAEEEPLEPLRPQLQLPTPTLRAVQYSGAEVAWPVPSITVPEAQDDRQAAFQAEVSYKAVYDLEVQAVDLGPPTAKEPQEQLLARVPGACTQDGWTSVKTLEECTGQPVTIPNLRAGRFYAARLAAKAYAVLLDDAEPWFFEDEWHSGVLALRTVPCPPGQMQAPSLAQRQRNTLKLKWSTPDETGGELISCYELKVKPLPPSWEGLVQDEEGFAIVYQGTDRSFLLNKLGPAQRYSFKIRCYNVLGCSPWSLPSTFTTQASVPAPPEPPRRVGSTKDSLTLQWDAPASNGAPVNFYELEADDGQGGPFERAYTGDEQRCVVPRLQSGFTYRFRLRAQNSEGWSFWSHVLEASTAAAVPMAPQDVELRRVTPTSVSLSWAAPLKDGGSMITLYQVELLAKSKLAVQQLGEEWTIIFQGQQLAASFDALLPGCDYQVRVAAMNSEGLGDYSHPKWVTAGASTPLAPDAPTAAFIEARALFLDWRPPQHDGGAPIQRYRIECRAAAAAVLGHGQGGDWWIAYNGPHTGSPVAVLDLAPGMGYDFRVAAINEHGLGEFSPAAGACTHAAEPLQPGPPQLQGVGATTMRLAWGEPHGQGAPITRYRVGLACLSSNSGSGSAAVAAQALGGAGSGGGSLAHSRSSSTGALGGLPSGQQSPAGEAAPQSGEQSDDADSTRSGGDGGPVAPKLRWETPYNGSAPHAELKNLRPATRYLVQVRAFNAVGASPWSEVVEVVTAPAAPGPPAALTAEASSSSSSMRLSWQPPAEDNGAPVVTYFLEVASASAAAGGSSSSGHAAAAAAWHKAWHGAGSGATVDGLLPGRRYSWRLRAANACGLGPWCEPVQGTTLPSRPCAPPKPSLSKVTAGTVVAKWGLPLDDNGSTVNGYELQVRQQQPQGQQPDEAGAQQGGAWATVYQGKDLVHKLTGLQAGRRYELRVAASNRVGTGPFSEPVAWTTSLLPPPAPVVVAAALQQPAAAADPAGVARPQQQQREHGADVSWEAAAPPPDSAETVGYEVEALPAATSAAGASGAPPAASSASAAAAAAAAAVKVQVAGQATAASLVGLRPGRTYSVRVRAVGKGGTGHSQWSEAAFVTTPEAPAALEADTADATAAARPEAGKRAGKTRGKGGKAGQAQQEAQAAEQQRRGAGRGKLGVAATSSSSRRPKATAMPAWMIKVQRWWSAWGGWLLMVLVLALVVVGVLRLALAPPVPPGVPQPSVPQAGVPEPSVAERVRPVPSMEGAAAVAPSWKGVGAVGPSGGGVMGPQYEGPAGDPGAGFGGAAGDA